MKKNYNVIYPTRPVGTYPQIYVRPIDKEKVDISYYPLKDEQGATFRMTRMDARLLARRINHMLGDKK